MARHGSRSIAALAIAAALALAATAHATFPGTNGKLIYHDGQFPSNVWQICPNGLHLKKLMPNASSPVPSPDGSKIAYMYFGNDGFKAGVWIMNADGTNPVQMTGHNTTNGIGGEYPSWSPDGTKLTFNRHVSYPAGSSSGDQPVVQDVATGQVTPLLNDRNFGDTVFHNAWSPDGQYILFSNRAPGQDGWDLWRVPATGGTPVRLLGDGTGFHFQAPAYTPDGTKFLLHRHVTGGTATAYWRYDADGSGGEHFRDGLPQGGNTGDQLLNFSPDGTKLAMVHTVSGTQHISTANADGSNVVNSGGQGTWIRWAAGDPSECDPNAPPPAQTYDKMRIDEVMLAKGGAAAQFLELRDTEDETFPTAKGPYRIVIFDGAGARQGAHTMNTSTLQNRDNRQPFLIATVAAATALAVTRDETLAVGLPTPGQACYTQGAEENVVNCVAWGCMGATVNGVAKIAVPADGRSIQRQGAGAIWQVGTPTPKANNVAGAVEEACPETATPPAGDGTAPQPQPQPPAPSALPATPFSPLARRLPPAADVQGAGTLSVRRDRVQVRIGCRAGGPPCPGSAALSATTPRRPRSAAAVRLGSASFTIPAGATKSVTIKLSRAAVRLLRRSRRVKATLVVTVSGGAAVKRTVTLRR